MGNPRGLGLHLIFVCVFLFAATYTCFGDRNTTSFICSEQERLALLKFKDSVYDVSGMLSSWVGNECCMWEGIQCDGVTGNVQSLHLNRDYNNDYFLDGHQVSSSLAELRHLKYLDLSGNRFHFSQIPEFIGSLKHLIYLNLSDAGFEGIIPPHIGNLSNLKVLDLNWNGGLKADDMAWAFGLSSLELFDLSSLDLSGAQNWDMVLHMIPSLTELSLSRCGLSNVDVGAFLNSSKILPNIKHLDLGYNSFKGPLPSFFQNMTSLTFLDLSGFNLSLSWNFPNLLSMIPSLSELHLSHCGLDKTHLSSPHLNFSTLSNIQHLDLSDNPLGGIFPYSLTNITSLRVLDLSDTMLNSSLPIMPKLVELHLSSNNFKEIEDVGLWRQCHLKQLSVVDNEFDMEMIDPPKNASECSRYALEFLYLTGSLKGRIPKTLGRLANLRYLDLRVNGLTGSIPESLRRLRFLEALDLSYNQLTGPIPEFLGNLTKLDLSYNHLTGLIPEFLGNLTQLDISYNHLTGLIPEFLGNLTKLDLSSNQLTGSIPESLGKFVALKYLNLGSNLLNGTIPFSIGQLAKLRSLYIYNNSLEGTIIEAHFANLSMLKYLDTSSNSKLSFNVSCGWMPPFQLIYLDLSSCYIGNGFPQWLRNQRKLRGLELSNTTLSGPLPTWLRKLPTISFLDLSHNKLNGSLTNFPNAQNDYVYVFDSVLLLESNHFNGSIPRSLCRRKNLQVLDLSRNMLNGRIPKCLGNLQSLIILKLSSNQLSGVIPSSIGLHSQLVWLNLNDNNFIGEVPRELGNLPFLQLLDLGDNKFSGNIPKWVGEKLISLVVLRLHKNNFTGRIPRSICQTSSLHILDVSYNNLKGTIPHCVGKLDGMVKNHGEPTSLFGYSDKIVIQVMKGVVLEYGRMWSIVYNMDLSSNKLVGEIPVELTALSMLVGLNLSNNHLSGGIPVNIGNMKKLESLDFSKNELSGKIPSSMATLNFLSHLNLSHNNLSGQIPTGAQLQTLIDDPSIYVGNKDLCGPPLPKSCSNHEDPTTTSRSKKKHKAVGEQFKVWLFYVDIISGFASGFWGVIGVLLFKKQWRRKLFMFVEEMMDKIYVAVAVRVAKIKRGREAI